MIDWGIDDIIFDAVRVGEILALAQLSSAHARLPLLESDKVRNTY